MHMHTHTQQQQPKPKRLPKGYEELKMKVLVKLLRENLNFEQRSEVSKVFF